MFFLGYNFLGADETAIPISPVVPSDNTSIEVFDVYLDTLAASKNVDSELTADISEEWDWDTILLADFNNDTFAGNIKWAIDTITHMVIKRRVVGSYKWMTLAVQEVNSIDDLNMNGTDITSESLEYEYAIVPMFYGNEGPYSIATVDVTNEDLVVIDSTGIYHTPLTDGYCDTTDVHPNSVLELLHNRYPTIVRNTMANYETINVTGQFIPYKDDCIDFTSYDDDRRRVLYQREVKEFLTNGRAKILKNVDGQCWLVYVTTPPTDSADNIYMVRKLTFGCTETGSLKSEEDLYYAGLLDVPPEWWSSSS